MKYSYIKTAFVNFISQKKYLTVLILLLVTLKINSQTTPPEEYPLYYIFIKIDSTLSNLDIEAYIKMPSYYSHHNRVLLTFPFFSYSSTKSSYFEKVQSRLESPIKYTITDLLLNNKPCTYNFLNDSTIFITARGYNDTISIKIKYSIQIPVGQIIELPVKYGDITILNRFYPYIRWNQKELPTFNIFKVSAEIPKKVSIAGSSEMIIDKEERKNIFNFKECISKSFTVILSKTRRLSTITQSDIVKYFHKNKQRTSSVTKLIKITNDYVTWLNKNINLNEKHLIIIPVSNKNYHFETGLIFVPETEIQKITNSFIPSIENYLFYITTQYVKTKMQTSEDNFIIEALKLLLVKNYLSKFPIKKSKDFKTMLKFRFFTYIIPNIEKFYNFNTSHTLVSSKNLLPFTKELIAIQYYDKLKTFKNIIGDKNFYSMLSSYFATNSYKNQHIELIKYFKQISDSAQASLIDEVFKSNKKFNIRINKLLVEKSNNKFINKIIVCQNYNATIPIDIRIKSQNSKEKINLTKDFKPYRDTLIVVTTQPISSIEVNPDNSYHEVYFRDNYLPRKIHITPFYLIPKPEAYHIIFYPDIKFNRKEYIRIGVTFKGSHWIGLRPLLPSEERNDWYINLNYGILSKLPGYSIGYSTAIPIIPGSPRIDFNFKSTNNVENVSISTDYYLGEIGYLLLGKIHGYKKLLLTYSKTRVKSLKYLDANKWETGRYNSINVQFINYHNWIVLRHMLIINYEFTPCINDRKFNYRKYSMDLQLRYKIFRRIWSFNRIFFGNIIGVVPKQNLFYIFGKNTFENTLLSNFYQIKGSGDMRGYGKRNLSGKNILTTNNEFIYNLFLYNMIDLDILIFTDFGIIPKQFNKIHINDMMSDAGLGIRLNLFENIKIGVFSPIFISHPPKNENKFKARFIISTDIKLK
ncbi:MAG: hypothetical protein H0Z29_08910 [Candidatus Marinimicrobia bacterium]|nr:hypothetical protein [Candidatus Neomarinimicrobiota bacterium]